MSKKDKSGLEEIIENPEALKKEVFKVEGFFEKEKNKIIAFGIGFLVAVGGYLGYSYLQKNKEKEAQAALFDAVYSFEADSLNAALKGQGGNEGLLSVADSYGSTKAGGLANLYSGIALMKEGKFADAVARLEKFSGNDDVLQPRAYSLIGDCYLEQGEVEDAIKSYKKAADYKQNKYATPGYMMKLGNAYQEGKNNAEAIKVYASLVEKYPNSMESMMAKKYKSKLETEIGGN